VSARRRPVRTVRLRLTLLYGGLFLATGALLVGLVYLLVAYSAFGAPPAPPAPDVGGLPELPAPQPPVLAPAFQDQLDLQRAAGLRGLLISSGLALTITAAGSVLVGWLVAGRVLRPLATMTTTVRRITADDLHRRLATSGPDDELKELADTFDDLLDRLERAFGAQRRFVANASHELRTPLTVQRAAIEVALADADAPPQSLRETLRRLLSSGEHQERIIEALLTLARSQQGLARWQDVDLAEVALAVLDADGAARDGRPAMATALAPAPVAGDPELLERMVANLISNAERHNVPDGWVNVATSTGPGCVVLEVANSGPVVPPDQVAGLLEPFRTLGPARTRDRGLGLGLSIVAAIAQAHGGTVALHPRAEGGLDVRVILPGGT
jgi:signal transduction histidine kinase